jgi:hypothetical protein
MSDPGYDSTISSEAPLGGLQWRVGEDLAAERGVDGVWRYKAAGASGSAAMEIAVPGARDWTLADAVDVRVVARRDGTPEAALVTRKEIDAVPALDWVPSVGKLLRLEPEEEFEVQWAVWQERAVEAIDVRAPERDGTGLSRLLATEERSLRFARSEVERLSERRARTVAIATRLGETRRAVSDIVGLSTGRIQQIIEDLPATVSLEVDRLLDDLVAVVRYIGAREMDSCEVVRAVNCEEGLLAELAVMGLLAREGSRVRVTEAGERAELHLRTTKRKGGQ